MHPFPLLYKIFRFERIIKETLVLTNMNISILKFYFESITFQKNYILFDLITTNTLNVAIVMTIFYIKKIKYIILWRNG